MASNPPSANPLSTILSQRATESLPDWVNTAEKNSTVVLSPISRLTLLSLYPYPALCHYLPAHGFAAHGFLAAQGFTAHGFAAQGLVAQGLTAHGFATHGLTAHGFLAAHGFMAHGFFAAQGLQTFCATWV
ncbi:MAG: hypothetical protein GY721_08225 [Deltaproteobacteria bacterium]|nr:hypothetical protein [Deltaproteobacteria bacterium]